MEIKYRRRIYQRSIIRILAAMLAVVLVLNTAVAVYAKEAMIPQISAIRSRYQTEPKRNSLTIPQRSGQTDLKFRATDSLPDLF